MKEIARIVAQLHPGNFLRLARDLQFRLTLEHTEEELPSDYVVSSQKPPPDFFSGVRRVLLIAGPAIGVGDEIILFPLPYWIKAAHPQARVTVMTGYEKLWDRVTAVDEQKHYRTHLELLEHLQAKEMEDAYDLLLLADFEKPGLAVPVCLEGRLRRYVELSLGAQCATVLDNRARRIWSLQVPLEAKNNYYDALEQMAEWLGLCPEAGNRWSGIVRRETKPSPETLRIFVTPFTSKYEPPVVYWSRFLSSLFPEEPCRKVEFVLDPGPNLVTERFSVAVSRAAAMRAARGVQFRVAHSANSRTLSLEGVFGELESTHIVLCADSFVAHAAPQFGCMVIVVAGKGLKNWRTPSEQSYYFDADQTLDEIVPPIRHLIDTGFRVNHHAPLSRIPFEELCAQLDVATRDQISAMRAGDPAWNGIRSRFLQLYNELVGSLPGWPSDLAGLFRDVEYGRRWCIAAAAAGIGAPDEDVSRHLRREMREWERSNLRKFLRLSCSATKTTMQLPVSTA